jgi:DNA gyrase subunit B
MYELCEIEDIIKTNEKTQMVDITVQTDKSFVLSNGVISHNSARGAFQPVRDKMIHSLIPLKGKCKNVYRLTLPQVIKNKEYENLIKAVHLGTPDNLRHGTVWIATDADPDGAHIRVLLIQFFSKFFPWFIEQNRLAVLNTPKYSYKIGKTVCYSFNDEIPKDAKDIKFFKGLGSLTKDAVKYSINNPQLITIKNVEEINKVYNEIYSNEIEED